jgi:hypothetical protein
VHWPRAPIVALKFARYDRPAVQAHRQPVAGRQLRQRPVRQRFGIRIEVVAELSGRIATIDVDEALPLAQRNRSR